MSGFQKQVTVQPGAAVAGDFASANPRFTYDAGPGGLVAGPLGLTVGSFAWVSAAPVDADGTPQWASNTGNGAVAGFVARDQQGLTTQYLQEFSMKLPAGFQTTLFTGGDFWVVNSGAGAVQPGMKAYADFSDGSVSFAATGSPTTGGTSSASTIAAGTSSVTASIDGDLMTVTAVGSGVLYNGTVLSGSGVASGTQIVSQVSGTPRGVGVYRVSIANQSVASTTISGTYGLLTIGGTVTGNFGVGDVVTGSGISGTNITDVGTGAGGAGTYIVNKTQSVSSQAINAQSNIETKWFATSAGLAGDLIKISSQPLG